MRRKKCCNYTLPGFGTLFQSVATLQVDLCSGTSKLFISTFDIVLVDNLFCRSEIIFLYIRKQCNFLFYNVFMTAH